MTSCDDGLESDDEVIVLTAEQEAELELSVAQADRGELVPAAQVLAELRARTEQFRLSRRPSPQT